MVNYNDFAKYWSEEGGQRAVDEGWGASDPNAELRRRFGIPDSITNQQIQNYYRANGLPDPKSGGGLGEFLSPIAFIGASALGGPVGGSIAAANGSGATSSLGIDPRLTTAAALGYGAYNSPGDVAGSEYGVAGTAPVKPDYWNNTYAANDTGTLTDASGVAGEPPMWDWLDSIDQSAGFDPGAEGMWNPPAPGVGDAGAFDQTGSLTGATDNSFNPTNDTIFGGTASNPMGGGLLDTLKQYGSKGLDAFKALGGLGALRGNASTGSSGGGSAGKGILDTFLGDPLQAAFNSAPFLLALNESNKQAGDINGVLNNINGDAYTKSVLNPYDMETGHGRYAMQNDQALRGVSGSSFGDQALGNYDYTRSLGRSDMASKAQLAAAGLQGSLINSRNTNRNLLLGAGLSASGSLFKPQQDPFNLRALLGV